MKCPTSFFIAIILSFFLIVSCSTMAPREEKQRLMASQKKEIWDEIRVGRGIAAKLLGHFGSQEEDKKALEYINLVGKSLVADSGRAELQYSFAILKSNQVNAFATPGGYVFVTEGLLRAIESESELAVVLGHEIAHVNMRHMYDQIRPRQESSVGSTMVRMMSRGHSDMGKAVTEVINAGLKILLEEGLDQQMEDEADQAGMLYASASGYDSAQFLKFLKRLEKNKAKYEFAKSAGAMKPRLSKMISFYKSSGMQRRRLARLKTLNDRFSVAMKGIKTSK